MCVVQIINYTSSLWGFKKFEVIDNIQNRFFYDTRTQKPKIERISGGIFQAKRYGVFSFR